VQAEGGLMAKENPASLLERQTKRRQQTALLILLSFDLQNTSRRGAL
jgi:hypothetical protein